MKKIFSILVAGLIPLFATAQNPVDSVATPDVTTHDTLIIQETVVDTIPVVVSTPDTLIVVDSPNIIDTLTMIEETPAIIEILEEITEEATQEVTEEMENTDTIIVVTTPDAQSIVDSILVVADTTAVIADTVAVVADTTAVTADTIATVAKDIVVITDTIVIIQKLPTPIVTPRVVNKPQRPTYSAAKPSMYVDLGLPSGTLWKSYNEPYIYTYEQATKLFGESMPTEAQMIELQEECIWYWTGAGYRVTGPNGEVITMPAGGYTECEEAIYPNNAIYWVNSVDSEYPGPSRFTITPLESYFDCPDPANLKCTYYSVRLVK